MKITTRFITITTKSHWGGHTQSWTLSEAEHIDYARDQAYTCLEGYDDHRGDDTHADFPQFDDEGEQISGATEATIEDAIAWYGHDVQSIKIVKRRGPNAAIHKSKL